MKILDKISSLIPKEYKYTAGAPSDGGFKFVVDATPELRKTVKETLVISSCVIGSAIIFNAIINSR